MPLVLPKTYGDGLVLTEEDLDNIRLPMQTLLNTTRLDESFLDLDSIIESLSSAQVNSLLSIASTTEVDSFLSKATDEEVEILRQKRAKFVSSIEFAGTAFSSASSFTTDISIFTAQPDSEYLVSLVGQHAPFFTVSGSGGGDVTMTISTLLRVNSFPSTGTLVPTGSGSCIIHTSPSETFSATTNFSIVPPITSGSGVTKVSHVNYICNTRLAGFSSAQEIILRLTGSSFSFTGAAPASNSSYRHSYSYRGNIWKIS